MNCSDWYTDTVDVYRIVSTVNDGLTSNNRVQVYAGIPCRIYRTDSKAIRMNRQAADIEQEEKLSCGTAADIRTGDELIIHRGAKAGAEFAVIRAFAGQPNYYVEPFGAVIPGLKHQEIVLKQQERVK